MDIFPVVFAARESVSLTFLSESDLSQSPARGCGAVTIATPYGPEEQHRAAGQEQDGIQATRSGHRGNARPRNTNTALRETAGIARDAGHAWVSQHAWSGLPVSQG
jgi:hypothetical protein